MTSGRSGALLARTKEIVESALEAALDGLGSVRPSDGPGTGHRVPARLLEAMRYSLLSPGKRLRPALTLGVAELVGGEIESAIPAACAVEMVHAYSLVHDDLPALDNDDLRRGRPSCHKRFDEAIALLAGDALLTEALTLLADDAPSCGSAGPADRRARAVLILGRAVGAAGMVGGQVDDLQAAAEQPTSAAADRIRSIHRRKTGRLIQAAVEIGAIVGGGSEADVDALRGFGADIGLAFQLVDDALDSDGLAAVVGASAVRARARELTGSAIATLEGFGAASNELAELAKAMVTRGQ